MSVPEHFIVYQVEATFSNKVCLPKDQADKPGGWIPATKDYYERYEGNKRRLAVLPIYTAYVKRWFSAANGWYCTIELRDQNKVVLETPFCHTDGDQGWVSTLISWMVTTYVTKHPGLRPQEMNTRWLREDMNIDYFVEEVKRKADL